MSKVILITGGSSGIGKAVGDYLTQKKYTVYGTSRNPKKYTNTNFKLLQLDVTKTKEIVTVVNQIVSETGKIDVLINNAGVGITGPIEETPEEEIVNAFNTNYFGPIQLIKAVLPHMRNQKKGLIINITSIAGFMGLPYRGIYSATKGALAITAEALRMEIKQFGIKMTNIAPGDFTTNIASGRYHSPVLADSPYNEVYKNTLAMMNDHVNAGQDPIIIAKMIHQIIKTKNPKVHYKVGERLQKLSVLLKCLLPDTVYEKMLLNHYKLK